MVREATLKFFESIDRRPRETLLEKVQGTVRVDLHQDGQTDHWFVQIDRGVVSVSRDEREADCVVVTDPDLFEQFADGTENALAAGLRGALTVAGKLHLFLLLERLFPSPPDSHGPRRLIRSELRR
jgi:putative sterol carrier protein